MSSSIPKTYTAASFEEQGSKLTIVQKDIKQPGKGQVLVKVLACGVCHSDAAVGSKQLPVKLPLVPGHEIIGDVVAVGDDVTRFKTGARVGGAWHGGHDGTCKSCQKGFFQTCENAYINGVLGDGGYAEYVLLRQEAAVPIPDGIDPVEAAPLLCAGVTVFNAIRQMKVLHGSRVAVQGLGGLGHLAVQYANKMGYEVVALSSGSDKKDFATKLGAHHYIDTKANDAVKELQNLGGADLVVATAPNAEAIGPLVGGLAAGGKLLVLAPVGPISFDSLTMVIKGASVHGWPSGHAQDSEEAIAFAQRHGVKCLVEAFPLKDAQKAFDHMLSGKVRFRSVLTM
ncbi:alcohol dehydrogenase GroES-like domain-containing protein [Coniella lustricola]|uniref:Alcohol dehydrogenase GroES-like domain-containing protein n=1 Tax=Coniella lustricola TaxID=2025994 RepID=A0A2T2ZUL6_9PEZI|nr:alcohol dehydrogenase GroES-like domain-containing protein [Coniella lustricola]